jgi:hypothetical protein
MSLMKMKEDNKLSEEDQADQHSALSGGQGMAPRVRVAENGQRAEFQENESERKKQFFSLPVSHLTIISVLFRRRN